MKRTLVSLFMMPALFSTLSEQAGCAGGFNFLQLNNSAETAAPGGGQVEMPA